MMERKRQDMMDPRALVSQETRGSHSTHARSHPSNGSVMERTMEARLLSERPPQLGVGAAPVVAPYMEPDLMLQA